jgi:hypothetical protein
MIRSDERHKHECNFKETPMKVTRVLKIAAAFALAALIFAIANPKTVHAVVSTLVTVANTPANPVPVSGTVSLDPGVLDHSARRGIQLFSQCTFNSNHCDGSFSGSQGSFRVPDGHRLVIQTVSFRVLLPATQQVISLGLSSFSGNVAGPGVFNTYYLHLQSDGPVVQSQLYSVAQPLTAYADAGTFISFDAERNSFGSANDITSLNGSLSGYLIDCNVEPCDAQP